MADAADPAWKVALDALPWSAALATLDRAWWSMRLAREAETWGSDTLYGMGEDALEVVTNENMTDPVALVKWLAEEWLGSLRYQVDEALREAAPKEQKPPTVLAP